MNIENTILVAIGIIGGLLLCIGMQFTKHPMPRWVRTAFSSLGLFAIGWALFLVLLHDHHIHLAKDLWYRAEHFKTLCSGMALGISLTLFISGEIKVKRSTTDNKPSRSIDPVPTVDKTQNCGCGRDGESPPGGT